MCGDGVMKRVVKVGIEDGCWCWIDWGRRIRINRRDEGMIEEVGCLSDEVKILGKEEIVVMILIDDIVMMIDGVIVDCRADRRRFFADRRRDRVGLKSEK